jgi:hypothetical protein
VTTGGSGNAGKLIALDANGKLEGRVITTDGSKLDSITPNSIKVSATDTTPSYLNDKLVSGNGINLTKLNTGFNESIKVDGVGLSPLNRDMQATITTSDNNLACPTAILSTPSVNSWIQVQVNGVSYKVGNGTKIGAPCYFSGDGGVTARATGWIISGDYLYWNGSVAGFQLDITDRIDFLFEAL